MKRYLVLVAVISVALGACGQVGAPETAQPTSGAQLSTASHPQRAQVTQHAVSSTTILAQTPAQTEYIYQGRTLPAQPVGAKLPPPT
jgi:hypothetical protein